jgi:hypothetical protein
MMESAMCEETWTGEQLEQLEHVVSAAIYHVTSKDIADHDQHLLNDAVRVQMVDFLYVFETLEKELNLPVADILKDNDFSVFTIRNLAKEILRLKNAHLS